MTSNLLKTALVSALALMAAPVLAQQAAAPAPAAAAASATPYLVVDLNRVVRESAALKAAQPTLDSKRTALEAKVKSYQDQFRTEGEALQKQAQSGVAAPDVLEARQRDLQAKVQRADQDINNLRNEAGKVENFVVEQILNASRPVINTVIQERGANLVLNREAVVFAAPAIDITGTVIARLNTSLPTVSTTPPADKPATTPQKPAAPVKK